MQPRSQHFAVPMADDKKENFDGRYAKYNDSTASFIAAPQYPHASSTREYSNWQDERSFELKQDPKTPYRAQQSTIKVNRGWTHFKRPYFCWLVSVIQLGVFLGQIAHAWKLTGSPIQIKPTFNPLIGPSTYNTINMGARFPPCMRSIPSITDVQANWPCPNATTTEGLSACTLATLCGNGATLGTQPKQWWRFIAPIFLHAGVIHIGFNLLVQLRLGPQVELEIGSYLFAFIYLVSGIAGFLFGGNFAGQGITSVGASGALFSVFALNLLVLLYRWKQIVQPGRALAFILLDMVISLVLGLLPGVDNFSHIGGWIFGMLLGVAFLRSPDSLSRSADHYHHLSEARRPATSDSELRFYQERQPAWYALIVLRIICLTLATIAFVLLIKNFYVTNPAKCSWCKYLSCLPVSNWCSIGDLTTINNAS